MLRRVGGVATFAVVIGLVYGGCGDGSEGMTSGRDLGGDDVWFEDSAGPPDGSSEAAWIEDTTGQPDLTLVCEGDGILPFGCPCSSAEDCASGYCIEGPDGFICTKDCVEDCPAGYRCLILQGTCSDCAKICVPDFPRSCNGCAGDADCVGGRCIEIDGKMVCADQCQDTGTCHEGFDCVADDSQDGISLCLPVTGTCSCGEDDAGQTRACSVSNDLGSCDGLETCDPAAGWIECTAAE